MIQRIQTVFLLLAIIALCLFLWMPLLQLDYMQVQDIPGWKIFSRYPFNGTPYQYYINAILTGTAIGITLVSIFLFKKRSLQMLFCWFAVILIVSAQAYVFYEYNTFLFPGEVVFRKWNAFSGLAVVFEILAFVYIRKDENTIRSLDRLR